ncbi:hypothetical protein [Citrobacter koseri]|uniref:hypothetical protein n=1 Tax=Citrobacter koseri TaxID=545 RepID=UPI001CE26A54|nr:hypothetical protein [Citrobacter koseri]
MKKISLSFFFLLFTLPSFGKDFIKPSFSLQGLDMAGCLILNEETAKAGENYYRISPETFEKATDRVTDKLHNVEADYFEKIADAMDKQGFKTLSAKENGYLDIKIKAIKRLYYGLGFYRGRGDCSPLSQK